MPFDPSFLTSLPPADPEEWGWALYEKLQDVETELAGVLYVAQGRPFAVVWGTLPELHACEVSPGAMLAYGLWWGADALLPFHTQVTPPDWNVEPGDVDFANRQRDLAQLLGSEVRVHDHLLVTGADVPIVLDAERGLRPPLPLEEIERWTRTTKVRRKPLFRHPLGPTWSGTGSPPLWAQQLEDAGVGVENFRVRGPGDDEPGGVPPGGEQVFVTLDAPPPVEPSPGLRPIPPLPGLSGVFTPERLAQALAPLAARENAPSWGVVFLGHGGRVLRSRPGWTVTSRLARTRPELLLRPALAEGAVAAVTFSIVPRSGPEPLEPDRRELLRRLVFLGRLLGLPVRHHLVLRVDGRWVDLATVQGRRHWPKIPPVDEPAWPPFRRAHQAETGYAHPAPGDERTWSGRGPQPDWVRDLIVAGWLLDELRTYH